MSTRLREAETYHMGKHETWSLRPPPAVWWTALVSCASW
jgi:hypothetical protein